MRKSKQLASLTLAVFALAGTSAFAESRHSNETRSRGEARGTVRRGGTPSGSRVTVEGRRGDNSRNRSVERRSTERRSSEGRSVERRSTERRSEGRTYERPNRSETQNRSESRYRSSDRYRNDGRFENDGRFRNDGRYDRGRSRSNYGNRKPYYAHGRVSRYQRYGGGYHVWIHGAPYPFYVPLAYWNHNRFRIGLTIGLGGYYNSLGYYDYWTGYRDGSYNSGYRAHSEADFRGVVESVDHRRDSFVVRNDDTGNFITVVLRDERESLPRPGDYVAVRGDWTNQGYFRAYDLDFLDYDRNDRYDRY